jgi:hypothetical protein
MRVQAVPSRLLEREGDLARMDRALARARDGRGVLVVVEGPAGVGKTALLADARAMAESAGMRVLRPGGPSWSASSPSAWCASSSSRRSGR